mmetsp:Transcript_45999/g.80835  ORF Transcript_45999/g.80835 Transcript_45999/m.80835 type:complete len:792 (-) Transcript_45999:116-2491(-)
MATQLSRGAIPLLYSEQRHSDGRYQPILQVFAIEEMPQRAGQPRLFMICLSDGEQWTTSMLTPRAEVCMQGPTPVALHSVVRLVEWTTEDRRDQTLVFVRELQHLQLGNAPIGDPVRFDPQPQPDGAADALAAGMAPGIRQSARSDAELGRFLTTQPGAPAPASGAPAAFASNPYSANPYAQQSTMSFQAAPHAQQQLQQPGSMGQAGVGAAGPTARAAPNEPLQQVGYGGVPRAAATAPWHHQAPAPAAPPSEPPASRAPQPTASYPSWSGLNGLGGSMQQQAATPYRSPATGRPLDRRPSGSSMGAPAPPITVAGLSPYNQRWTLTARIMRKNTIRKFNYKAKEGEGQLFSISLLDREGGETRGTFFGSAVDNFYEMLQEGQTYNFSGGRVKQADKRWCQCEHEITFDENTVITPVEATADRPKMVFDFKKLDCLESVQVGTSVDVAAVVIEVDPPSEVNLKAGGTKLRMNVTLMDDSATTCRLTLWGEQTEKAWREGEVVLLKGLKVGDFGGRSLSAGFGTVFAVGRDAMAEGHPRAQELASWFAEQGSGARGTAKSISSAGGGGGNKPPQNIAEMRAEDQTLDPPGGTNVTFYHTISPATVTFLPHERAPFYYACVQEIPDERAASEGQNKTRSCMKKTERMADGLWCCGADHRCAEARARWVASFAVADQSGSQMVSAFDESGREILGVDAPEAARLWELRDVDAAASDRFEQLFKDAQFKRWRMRLRSRKELWNDEERVKVNVVECRPLNYTTEGRKMLEEVMTACGEGPNNGRNATVAAPACGG